MRYVRLFNMYGMVVASLCSALFLKILLALKCRENPNGLLTVDTDPGVIC